MFEQAREILHGTLLVKAIHRLQKCWKDRELSQVIKRL
jgi:hypothetical protein